MKRYSPSSTTVIDSKICRQRYGTVKVEAYTKDGVLVQSHEQPIASFLTAGITDIYNNMTAGLSDTFTALDGVTSRTLSGGSQIGMKGILGSYVGTVIGTGTTAPTFTDVTMATIIDHGTGAGQLLYEQCSVVNQAANQELYVGRTFRNDSGGSITVNEIGLAQRGSTSSITTVIPKSQVILIVRDVLSTGVAVPDGGYLSTVYRFSLAVATINQHEWLLSNKLGNTGTLDAGIYLETGVFRGGQVTANLGFTYAAGNGDFGILISEDSTAYSKQSVTLPGRIANGSSAGQIVYFASTVGEVSIDDGTGNCFMTLVREVFNDSGGTLNINSVGIRIDFAVAAQNSDYVFDRTVLPATVSIPNQTGRTFVYRFCYQF
jgi:hypothetical protein